MRKLLRTALLLAAACAAGPAFAVAYVFPGNLPAGCGGSGGNYTCGALSLGYNDTITIGSPTPATITINGAFSTSNALINNGGSAANLTLVVNGAMTVGNQARIVANVSATSINDNGSSVTFGGSLTTSTGSISIANASTVAGNLTSTSGSITLASSVQVAGQVSCTCALSMGNNARIVGNVSAASVNGSGQVFFNGSVATSGAMTVGNASVIGGGITASGITTLGGSSQIAQCIQSPASAAIRLSWGDAANGGVCCGAFGSCSSSCVVNNSGGAMPALCTAPSSATPGRFNAFDTGTAAGSISGSIHTKVSGTAFNVAVVAVNIAGTGLATTFTGSVRVELLDSSNNSGSLTSSTGCRSSWTVAAGTSASTLTFAAADAGRKNVSLNTTEAWRDARVRISYPVTGTATVVGCSTDNLAIRPDRFGGLAARDADFQAAGTARLLNNTAAGGNVHKAGQPFTVQAWAQNSAGSTTSNYSGTPTISPPSACGGTCGALVVTATSVTSGVVNATARYSEVGDFSLQLVDSSFTAVDASDGSTTAERNITAPAPATVGRFVPDHFDLLLTNSPQLRTFNSSTCTDRRFTYMGQAFGFVTRPQAMVLARNAAGDTTVNYASAKLNALTVAQTYQQLTGGAPPLDQNPAAGLYSINAIPATPGTAVLTIPSALGLIPELTVRRMPIEQARFSANITLTWNVTDNSEVGSPVITGNGTITMLPPLAPRVVPLPFDASSEFRFGMLKLNSAYGSELINMVVPIEVQYWNGSSFVTNAADQCTVLPTSAVALGPFRGNLSACETATGSTSVTFTNGRGLLRMLPPGSGNAGSADMRINLSGTASGQQCGAIGPSATPATTANMPWLQGKSSAVTTYTTDPSARISFGQYRSPLIHLREMY